MTRAACGYSRLMHRYYIRSILDDKGISMAELARRLDVTPALVSATILGKRHSPKVLDALIVLGVPRQYLFDPRVEACGK